MKLIILIGVCVAIGCAFILILSLCKMAKCEACNRFLDDKGKCLKCDETNDKGTK